VTIAIKPWTTVSDYGSAGAEINQAVLEEFRAKGIEIPFPQREVRLLNGRTPTDPLSFTAEASRA
jgi:small conductance mechanosensitive channel